MSLSVDDLISSFSSSHIGQEAIDLAALQAQLAESLFGACSSSIASSSSATSSRYIPRGRDYTQPCNTPTARTPSSSSFNWDSIDSVMSSRPRSRSSSVSNRSLPNGNSAPVSYQSSLDYEDDQDELMVEDMLLPSSPFASSFSASSSSYYNSPTTSSFVHRPSSSTSSFSSEYQQAAAASSSSPPLSSSSLFTSTDPFYLQTQASEQSYFYGNANANSMMHQYGRPNSASPFVQAAGVGGVGVGVGVGYHSMSPTAATAF